MSHLVPLLEFNQLAKGDLRIYVIDVYKLIMSLKQLVRSHTLPVDADRWWGGKT
jgi:hypothetical protein